MTITGSPWPARSLIAINSLENGSSRLGVDNSVLSLAAEPMLEVGRAQSTASTWSSKTHNFSISPCCCASILAVIL